VYWISAIVRFLIVLVTFKFPESSRSNQINFYALTVSNGHDPVVQLPANTVHSLSIVLCNITATHYLLLSPENLVFPYHKQMVKMVSLLLIQLVLLPLCRDLVCLY